MTFGFRIILLHLLVLPCLNATLARADQHILHDGDEPPGVHREQKFRAQFESAEHVQLGDFLDLSLSDNKTIKGSAFGYWMGNSPITFGQLVSLGDYFAKDGPDFSKCVQISDPGLTTDEREAVFSDIITQIKNERYDMKILGCVLKYVGMETTDCQHADDPAQTFAENDGGWDVQFAICTVAYVKIALCNWDHFGSDVSVAYTIGHSAALNLAMQAQNVGGLIEAYFAEGVVQHYLSDIFATGHLREPRRTLHSPMGLDPNDFYPGHQCAKFMHNEDCASGLWVTNANGASWTAYGDKQLFATKSLVNQQYAMAAMQAGVNELYNTYKTKQLPSGTYAALKMIPMQNLPAYQNYVPLFQVDATNTYLYMRSNLLDRGDPTVTTYLISDLVEDVNKWNTISQSISSSPIITNMYVRTIQNMVPEANITQIRQINGTSFLINTYGPIWTPLIQPWPKHTAMRSWNMLSQSICDFGIDPSISSWGWTQVIDGGALVLLGEANDTEILIALLQSTGSGSTGCNFQLLWDATLTSSCSGEKFIYGNFGLDSTQKAFLRICSQSDAHVELWVPTTPSSAPKLASSWAVISAESRQLLSVQRSNSSTYFVDVVYSADSNSYNWNITYWLEGYSTRYTTTYQESNSNGPTSNFLSGRVTSSNADEDVVRIWSSNTAIMVDVISIFGSSVSITAHQSFQWTQAPCSTTLYWILEDINSDGQADLVAFCSSSSDGLIVATFLATSKSSAPLSNPVFSTFPDNYLPLFNGDFLKPITVGKTQIFDPKTQVPGKNKVGLLQFFDNYGILGARLLAPVSKNPAAYTALGQIPAIAGQISKALNSADPGIGIFYQ